MQTKVYESDMKGLSNFIVDLENTYNLDVVVPGLIKRISNSKNPSYNHHLDKVISCDIIPKFNVVQNIDKLVIGIHLEEIQVVFKLKFTNSNTKCCSIVYKIPATRILLNITDKEVRNYLNNFYSFEEYLEETIKAYYQDKLKEIFSNKVLDDTSNEFGLQCGSYSCELKAKEERITLY